MIHGKPRIAATAGDPAGIGPEVLAKSLRGASGDRLRRICSVVFVGDERLLAKWGGLPRWAERNPLGCPWKFRFGRPSAAGGFAAVSAIKEAVRMIEAGEADAMMTGPAAKVSLWEAGCRFPGQTEMLAELCGVECATMMMYGRAGSAGRAHIARAAMITTHLPLSRAVSAITPSAVRRTLDAAVGFVRAREKISTPRVGVCAVNPHAGERGGLGTDEARSIAPAVESAAGSRGMRVSGPLPADAAFRMMFDGGLDIVIGMYHDQVMIPMKAVCAKTLVNVTAGLPFVRTSPGHGTAYDIAGRGTADPSCTAAAMEVAAALSARGTGI